MKNYVFEGVMTALSSISHNGGGSYGTTSLLRREKFVGSDGRAEEIPVLSGNGLRGMLRDRGMLHMCRTLGYGVDEENGKVHGLSLPAFYFLFSGGALTNVGGKAVDIDDARRLRALIPLVAVFGGAKGNSILPGKLKCGKAIPICSETAHLLPERIADGKPESVWEYLQQEMYTRKDDAKNERLAGVISPVERKLLEAAQAEKAKKSSNGIQEDTGQHQQMMYHVETFAAGTRFYWKLVLDDVTDLEFDAFMVCLSEWGRLPYVGGKSNIGLGEVSVKFDRWWEIDSRIAIAGKEVGSPTGAAYLAHLAEKRSNIQTALTEIQ